MAKRRVGGNEATITVPAGGTQDLTAHEGFQWSASTNDEVDNTTPYGNTTKRYERLGMEDPRIQISFFINVTVGGAVAGDRPALPDGTPILLTLKLTTGTPWCTNYRVILVNQRISPDRNGKAQRVTYDCLPCPANAADKLG